MQPKIISIDLAQLLVVLGSPMHGKTAAAPSATRAPPRTDAGGPVGISTRYSTVRHVTGGSAGPSVVALR